MRLLLLLLRSSVGVLILAAVCGLLSGAGNATLLAMINQALTQGAPPELAWRFAGLGVAVMLLRITTQVMLSQLHQGALFQLRTQLARRFLATPLRSLEEAGHHRLMANLTSDVLQLSSGLSLLPQLVINTAIITGCLVYMAWLSRPIFLALVTAMVLGIVTYLLPIRRSWRLLWRARETYDDLIKHFRSLAEGIKELKLHAHRREAFLREQLEPTASTLRSLDVRSSAIDSASASWGLSLFFGLIGLLLFVLPAQGSTAAVTGYILTLLYMQQPLDALLSSFHSVGQGAIALQRLESLPLASLEDRKLLDLPEQPAPSPVCVELRGVTHSYHREKEDASFTLGPIDLVLRQGELVFLVGGNGSGKTTLAKLLVGLYVPESGQIVVDGVPVTGDTRERYRQIFSAIFSDFFLFERLLGLSAPHLVERARGYLELLQLNHKVRIDATGALSTTELSQGQRKRLALLVSYLEDRPFYIFDEWAADQDPIFKEVFYQQLLPDLKRAGKAVLVISHDDRYFGQADRLVRLEAGKLAPELASVGPRALTSSSG